MFVPTGGIRGLNLGNFGHGHWVLAVGLSHAKSSCIESAALTRSSMVMRTIRSSSARSAASAQALRRRRGISISDCGMHPAWPFCQDSASIEMAVVLAPGAHLAIPCQIDSCPLVEFVVQIREVLTTNEERLHRASNSNSGNQVRRYPRSTAASRLAWIWAWAAIKKSGTRSSRGPPALR